MLKFHVIKDEKEGTFYDFEKRKFVGKFEVEKGCFLPTIDLAYKLIKNQHLFLKQLTTNKLTVKTITLKEYVKNDEEDTDEITLKW